MNEKTLDSEKFSLKIEKDASGITFGYEIIKKENGSVVIQGDGYETLESVITDLSELNEAFSSIFG